MMLNGTQLKIIEVFVSKITQKFSINQVSKEIKKPYQLVHRYFKPLADSGFVSKDNRGLYSLNLKADHSVFSYAESIRKNSFLRKNKTFQLFADDIQENFRSSFFVFLVFGSAAKGKKNPRDIDVIFIVKNNEDVAPAEKLLGNIASNFRLKLDINVVSESAAADMLSKRGRQNILNEAIDNHIIIYGAENFYRLLKNA